MSPWILAIRPRTLTGAVAPVLVGLAAAWHQKGYLAVIPAVLCLLFAVLMQIDANLFNDWWDCRKGVDTKVPRIGPLRVCAAGLVSMRSMLWVIILVSTVAATVGISLLLWSARLTAQMPFGAPPPLLFLLVGIACMVSFAAYSTFFSRWALGDILVIVFFGFIPVVCTFLLQDMEIKGPQLWCQALSLGLAADALLICNNYRDREGDSLVGKHTLCTLVGEHVSEWLYLLTGVTAALLATDFDNAWSWLLVIYLAMHLRAYRRLVTIKKGTRLNEVLAASAQNILVLALIICLSSIL